MNWEDPEYVHLILLVTLAQLLTSRSPRVRERLRAGEIVVAGDQWPVFLFLHHKYDPEDPWRGLLRGPLLLNVSV
jgi:hypothetical protein